MQKYEYAWYRTGEDMNVTSLTDYNAGRVNDVKSVRGLGRALSYIWWKSDYKIAFCKIRLV